MAGPAPRPLAARFWENVIKSDEGCWGWRGDRNNGYGRIAHGPRGLHRVRAHRLSWELSRGPIPHGLSVLHSCDNPPCGRPEHLCLGTRADNRRDMVAKGRDIAGERTPHARLREADVLEIYRSIAAGASQAAMATRFGVSRSQIWTIVHGRTWKSLAAERVEILHQGREALLS
jgi:hypothetical protein